MESDSSQMPAGEQPSEEELRARIEEQLRQVRVQDLLVDSTASIVNLTARRIAKPDEQDLEQAKVGIEAVRALAELIEGEVKGQILGALSELQLLYARAAKGEPLDGGDDEGQEAEAGQPPPQAPEQRPQPGAEAKAPPRLWTPGRD
ncbi:MAG: hypothetical protein M3383_10295 [Actinomycetota bacterium]|nr:hypothetical protein [Actinomycetota bacterium]